MRIVTINTSESTGGAAIAANRLTRALNAIGVEAKMLVRDKQTNDPDVVSVNHTFFKRKWNFLRFVWERFIIFLHNHFDKSNVFKVSIGNTGTDISRHPLVKNADIIHLHWINQGFLSLHDIQKLTKLGKPIVWTMHDMWPCTGICHHAYACNRYTVSCGKCPFLNSGKENDLSNINWHKKQFIQESSIQLVAVSSWLKNKAGASSLTKQLPVSVIPNVIDASIFKPSDKKDARQAFSFDLKRKIILMGAARLDEEIKGGAYLFQALASLNNTDQILLLLFGSIKDPAFLQQCPVSYVHLGKLNDPYRIAQLYASADVTVVPSLYETFGQTIIESMACGCPVVSFNNSGQTDIIDHLQNGYLAEYLNTEDLLNGIKWALDNGNEASVFKACVEKVKLNYTNTVVAQKYKSLYTKILQG